MKNKAIAIILLSSFLFASCSKQVEETTAEETTTTTEETTEETAGDIPNYRPTATPTPRPSPTPAETTEESEPEVEEIDYDAYEVIMNGIDEIEATDPGNILYKIGYDFSDRAWSLATVSGDVKSEYTIERGELVLDDTSEVADYDRVDRYFSYEEIKMLPCLSRRLDYLETGDFAESLEDDLYFGSLLAVSEDGRYGLFSLGTPVEFEQSFVDSLQVGDEIGYEDLYVTEIHEDGSVRWLTLNNSDLFFSGAYFDYTGTQLLCSSSVNPVRENQVLVVLPISTSCTVTDRFDILTGTDNDCYTSWQTSDRTGDPFFDSYFWAYSNSWGEDDPVPTSNGWYDVSALAYPVVVTNGEVTLMNLEWR